MKIKMLLVLLVLILLSQSAYCQLDLQIVWQKNVYPAEINFLKFSVDGRYIYCATANTIQKMDAKTGLFVSTFDNSGVVAVSEMNITRDGNFIITNMANKGLNIWDTKTEKVIKFIQYEIKPGYDGVITSDISTDGSYYICHSTEYIDINNNNGYIVKYDLKLGKEILRLLIDKNTSITKIAISHDGKYFATGSIVYNSFSQKWRDQLILWETDSCKQLAILEDIEESMQHEGDEGYKFIKFSNDNKLVAGVRRRPYEVHIYDVSSKAKVSSSDGRTCINIEFLPDSLNYILSYFPLSEYYQIGSNKFVGKSNLYMGNIELSITAKTVVAQVNGDSIYLLSLKTTLVQDPVNNLESLNLIITNNHFTLVNGTSFVSKLSLIITDLVGKMVIVKEITNIQPNSRNALQIELPIGIYLCKMTTENKTYSQKIQIVR